jgi:tetratricopeptide (TPR) repeat protein
MPEGDKGRCGMQKMRKITALCLALLSAPTLAGQWHVAETQHFRIYSEGSTEALAEQAAVLEDYRGLLDALTTRPESNLEPKLDIFLLDGIGDARPFTPMSRGIAGFYTGTSGRIAAYSVADDAGAQETLLHEYAHHYMLGTQGNVAYPRWYTEGFAEYFSTAQFTPGKIQVGAASPGRVDWLVYSEWMPIDRVLTGKFKRGIDVPRFYAQSWLMTHYLLRSPGMADKLAAYLQALTAGEENVAAFREKVMPSTDLQGALRHYLSQRKLTLTTYTRSPKTAAEVKVSALPASADPMLLLLANLEFGLPKDDRDAAVKRVREAAARFPGDPLAERTLAYAEMRYGDRTQGTALLDKLLAATPDDPTLLRWRGEAAFPREGSPDAAQAKDARKYLARAYKLDPGDWRTLYRYAMVEDPFAKALEPGTLEVLLRAHALAPQVDEIGVTTAVALARAGRVQEAAKIMEPIAHSRHVGPITEATEPLLAQLKAGDTAGFLAAAGPTAKLIRDESEF